MNKMKLLKRGSYAIKEENKNMSLIYKNKIPQLMVGYPTVSDKYNVAGAVLEGTQSVNNGELVTFGSASGGYKKITAITSAKDIAGIVLATNVDRKSVV